MHLGPSDVLLNLEVRFREGLPVADLEESIGRIESAIHARHPEVKRIFPRIQPHAPEPRQTASSRADGDH